MKLGIDTDVLVHAHLAAARDSARVRDRLMRYLADDLVTLFVTPMVIHEFVHVVTDGRRFDPPVPMARAVEAAREWLGASNVECLPVTAQATAAALALVEEHRLGRDRIADSLIAATFMEAGVRHLLTCNGRDYRHFEGLTVIDPRG